MAAGVLMLLLGVAVLSRLFRHDLAGRVATMNLEDKPVGSAEDEFAAANGAAGDLGASAAAAGTAAAAAGTSSAAAAVIARAKTWLGVPYSWGGGSDAGPTRGTAQGANIIGFDCSAFVKAAFAAVGVALPRTTYDQINAGTPVASLAQARPGDLIFPSRDHVEIYMGNGRVIEAPHTGDVVKETDAPSQYVAIRRVL
jgi:cell wall-associated NlpC family hydrolase